MSLKTKTFLALIALALLGGGAYYYLTTRVQVNDADIRKEEDSGYTIQPLNPDAPVIPSLERKTFFSSDLSADVQRVLIANIAMLKSSIAKNPSDLGSWMDLGVQYKIAGDYEGARLSWEYVKAVATSDWTAPYNLGNLYRHELKKPASVAEENYLLSIKNKPDYVDAYRALYELYRYSYPAKSAEAPRVLERGIAATPKVPDLVILLAAYYKDMGNKDAAIAQYRKAKTLAETLGNASLAAALQQEIDALQ